MVRRHFVALAAFLVQAHPPALAVGVVEGSAKFAIFCTAPLSSKDSYG
jgi:hypothetical protein